MLGINYTFIDCDKRSCKYNKNGTCDPPEDREGDGRIKIVNGKCTTYQNKTRLKQLDKFQQIHYKSVKFD